MPPRQRRASIHAVPPEQSGTEEPAAFRRFAAWAMERFDTPELLTWRDVNTWDLANGVGLLNRDPVKAMETHLKGQVDHLIAKLRLSWGRTRKTMRAFYSIRPSEGVDVPGLGYMPAPWVLQNIYARRQKLEQYARFAEGIAAGMRALRATPQEWENVQARMRQVWTEHATDAEAA